MKPRITALWPRGTALASSLRMLGGLGSLTVVAGLVAGSASLSSGTLPPRTAQEDCERNNGAWRQVLNFCEHGR
jgi:hypothetical protein